MSELNRIFEHKLTENGDDAFNTTGNPMLDVMFMTEYYTNHPEEVPHLKGTASDEDIRLFSMFVRDPRYGMGMREVGRRLFGQTIFEEDNEYMTLEDVVKAGRYDDLCFLESADGKTVSRKIMEYWMARVKKDDYLAKKWMPRIGGKRDAWARAFCNYFHLTHKEYSHLIKCDTVENKMTNHQIDEIDYEKVPSLAMLKYYERFKRETRFLEYLEQVKAGKKKINTACTTVYDIYRNRETLGDTADLLFDKLEKISLSCIPVVDVSGSMINDSDSIGKALSIGYYLAKCSTYAPNQFLTFSGEPQLVTLRDNLSMVDNFKFMTNQDWGWNTDFGAVMDKLSELRDSFPDYIVVLTDMEWDEGSANTTQEVMDIFNSLGVKTKIVFWNLNNRNATVNFQKDCPFVIYMSGYSPRLLKFLSLEFNAEKFLWASLDEYKKAIGEK